MGIANLHLELTLNIDMEISEIDRKMVWLFSGQGSQYPGMYQWYFDNEKVFRDVVFACEEITSILSGVTFIDAIYASRNPLQPNVMDTRVSNCALFSVQYAMAKLLQSKGLDAQLLIGFSLGEFVAHCVAGAMKPETALRALIGLADSLQTEVGTSAMTAVVKETSYFYKETDLFANCTLATVSSVQTFVVAGRVADLDRVESQLKSQRVAFQRLLVEFGFHSSAIDSAESEFKSVCDSLNFQATSKKVLSSAPEIGLRRCTSNSLWYAVRQPVMLRAVVDWCLENRIENFFDLGPSCTFANVLKEKISLDRIGWLCTPFKNDNEYELRAAIEAHKKYECFAA